MAKQIDSTYGDALYELAVEEQKTDSVLEEMTGLLRVFRENEELLQVLTHPEVQKEQKLELIRNVFQGRVSDDVMGMLLIVVQNDRSNGLIAICQYVIRKIKEYKKIGIASVTSASVLTAQQKSAIESKLVDTTDYNSMEMNYIVDPTIIGGLIIRIQDRVVDSSIKSQLERMSQTLSHGEM